MNAVLVEVKTLDLERGKRRKPVQTLTSTWTSGGVEHTVTTTRLDGESAPDFIARHNEVLEAALVQYPSD